MATLLLLISTETDPTPTYLYLSYFISKYKIILKYLHKRRFDKRNIKEKEKILNTNVVATGFEYEESG